jgi:hypothetical protein
MIYYAHRPRYDQQAGGKSHSSIRPSFTIHNLTRSTAGVFFAATPTFFCLWLWPDWHYGPYLQCQWLLLCPSTWNQWKLLFFVFIKKFLYFFIIIIFIINFYLKIKNSIRYFSKIYWLLAYFYFLFKKYLRRYVSLLFFSLSL